MRWIRVGRAFQTASCDASTLPHEYVCFFFFQVDMELRGRRMNRFESLQDLMDQYKKPLLASAFDLQSRLSLQVCAVCSRQLALPPPPCCLNGR